VASPQGLRHLLQLQHSRLQRQRQEEHQQHQAAPLAPALLQAALLLEAAHLPVPRVALQAVLQGLLQGLLLVLLQAVLVEEKLQGVLPEGRLLQHPLEVALVVRLAARDRPPDL